MLKAFDETTGKEINKGDIVKDFKGNEHVFVMPTRARTWKSGKVVVNTGEFCCEYYDKVFNIIVKEID